MARRQVLILAIVAVAAVGVAQAQPAAEPLRWHVYTGWSGLSGDASDYLEDGWMLGFGAIWSPRPGKTNLGLRFDMDYNWWDVKTGALPPPDQPGEGQLTVDDGDANAWTLRTALHVEGGDRTRFYGDVGIGGYSLYANVTNSVLVPGYICDPWYWWICYPALVEGEAIVADEQTTKFGYYATLGAAWEMGGGEGFVEASYHWVQTKETVEYIPIVLGYRW
jgi:opacity protein-like surface antigen